MKSKKRKIAELAANIAYLSAKRSANTACIAIFGQSKLPDQVKKLRKF